MKKTILFILLAALILLASCSAENENNEKNIVKTFGFKNLDMSEKIADINNIEAITEISAQIILCCVKSCKEVSINDLDEFNFTYEVEVRKIYLNVNDRLKEGDIIAVSSSEGIILANEAKARFGSSAHAQKFGYFNNDYGDNDYFTASCYDAVPIEVGKTYIMYLTDEYLENWSLYAETGRMYLYEIEGDMVYSGVDRNKLDLSFKKLEKQIIGDIEKRTGRVDEIGFDAYLDELAKKQVNSK